MSNKTNFDFLNLRGEQALKVSEACSAAQRKIKPKKRGADASNRAWLARGAACIFDEFTDASPFHGCCECEKYISAVLRLADPSIGNGRFRAVYLSAVAEHEIPPQKKR